MLEPMDLSIIIVNWNSREYLRACLDSILANTRGITFEIVVIDNASYDGAGDMLRELYPQVRFIQSDQNLGFARANNQAFRESRGGCLLFLNPDTLILDAAIPVMFDSLQRLPDAGALTCTLLNGDRSVQTSCLQAFPTILNQLLDSELLRNSRPNSPLWGMAPLFSREDGPKEVEAVSGACIMVKRSTFEQVGQFSEDYFMYAEDMDLCFKIRQAGHKIYYEPAAFVVHFGGGSTSDSPSDLSVAMMRESVSRFLSKTRGGWYGAAYRASMAVSAMVRLAVLIAAEQLRFLHLNQESLQPSFSKWRAILEWSLGIGVLHKTLCARARRIDCRKGRKL